MTLPQNDTHIVTIGRHIIDSERRFPGARGAFTSILSDLALAAKVISSKVNMAGLLDVLGGAGERNVQGEEVQKLDNYAQAVIYRAMDHTGHLACMASEEVEGVISIPAKFPAGDYVLVFDPLDGSSNIDVNISIGTVFGIYRKVSGGERGVLEDCLQPGVRQVAAGYVIYGSSTMLVYTAGDGVHGFTLDPTIGEFVLSHPDLRIPDAEAPCYSVNEAYQERWAPGVRAFLDDLRAREGASSRYVGSLVADVHRTLLRGGIFLYPADARAPEGKLRLVYEANPLAMVVEAAGGRASNGRERILGITPQALHQRTPLYIGSASLVEAAEKYLRSRGGSSAE
jgi:fructose-1,6-bisphosphatase I